MGSIVPEQGLPAAKQSENARFDFSRPFSFHLESQKPNKTIDIGKDGTSLSLDACGRVLQASTFHPEHGIIVAVPFEQFDGTKYYEPSYVRSYRTRMLQSIQDNKPGFGLDFGTGVKAVAIQIQRANTVRFTFSVEGKFDVSLEVQVSESGEIWQTAAVTNTSSEQATLPYAYNLCISLNRASYGQLTEGGPIPLPESHNTLRQEGQSTIAITNPALGAQLSCLFEQDSGPVNISNLANQEVRDAPLNVIIPQTILIQAGDTRRLQARFRFVPEISCHIFPHLEQEWREKGDSENSPWKSEDALTTYILRRNVDYILANCLIPISDTETCVITDHVALPLGWNRDNYWQIRLLLETHKHKDILLHTASVSQYASQIHHTARSHLNWVFRTAQRPHGFWHRSYVVTGKPKDHAIFQLDQQCYPLLELCDYLDYFPDEIEFVKELAELDVVNTILQVLWSRRDPDTKLWPTDETPGDDAVLYPHHFSSHILLWRTVSRLRDLYERIHGATSTQVEKLANITQELYDKTLSSFTVTHPETKQQVFAYLTDGHGSHTFYHDGNDIPTLFALEWKFVTPGTDAYTIWKNTMAFGLSPDNIQGYCADGPYRGLGSVHSPGAWVLGYFQELAYASQSSNVAEMEEAWRKIAAAMQWDGTFSEAVDAKTAECTSKAWFSWPGSMIGALIIKLRTDGLEDVLLKVETRG